MMNIGNPRYTTGGGIDCEVDHPVLGPITFTATAGAPDAFGREVWMALQARTDIAPVTPDQSVAVASRVQIELWLNAGGFPGGFENAAIVAAADAAGDEAKIRLRSGQEFRSDDPFLTAAAPALGITGLYAAVLAASEL